MPDTGLHIDAASLPRPGDRERAALGLERWQDQARDCDDRDLGNFATAFAEDSRGHALLEAVFGNSPFLGRSLLREMATARHLVTHGADPVFQDLLAELRQMLGAEGDASRVMELLRAGRRRAALVIALADIAGVWRIERVTAAL